MGSIDKNSFALVPYVGQTRVPSTQEGLATRMQSALNSSFQAQLQDYSHFHRYGMGTVVVLVGTSTAGKTSIIKALKQLLLGLKEDGGDLRCSAIDVKILQKYCPEEFEILKKLIHNPLDIPGAVFSKERLWKKGTSLEREEGERAIESIKKKWDSLSPEEKKKAQAAFKYMEEEMFDDAFEYSRRGGHVIFDILNIDSFVKHNLMRNFTGPLKVVLAFCPFRVLSSRMEKRNKEALESGQLSNQRVGEFPLMQFSEIYTQKEEGQGTFERLTRTQVTRDFDGNFDKGIEAARLEGRLSKSPEKVFIDKEKLRTIFLKNLGFREGIHVIEAAPRMQHQYHLIIDTSRTHPTESARIIYSYIKA
jgi:hypothetical protein